MDNFFLNDKEDIPPNVPYYRVLPVQQNVFLDAYHAGDQMARRSHTGVILFLNKAPVVLYSKRQNTM